jgi:GntR family transcriptional regulator
MFIRIDSSNATPIWQQIVTQLTRQVLSGNLEPEYRLPTVRELASDLRINPNTVARAYQELEREGIVETRRAAGTFVCDVPAEKTASELQLVVEKRLNELIVEALHMNLSREQLLDLFIERLDELSSTERII